MWLVRLALKRPYTFVVMALLILILGVTTVVRMPTDIFPDIDIPVISVVFNYGGLAPEEMEKRIVTNFERNLTTTVNDIEHIESQSLTGIAVLKVFFQPGAHIEAATAQVTAIAQTAIRQMPPGTTPPFIIRYSASNVPILQLALESDSPRGAERDRRPADQDGSRNDHLRARRRERARWLVAADQHGARRRQAIGADERPQAREREHARSRRPHSVHLADHHGEAPQGSEGVDALRPIDLRAGRRRWSGS
jgi:hypothetical protein